MAALPAGLAKFTHGKPALYGAGALGLGGIWLYRRNHAAAGTAPTAAAAQTGGDLASGTAGFPNTYQSDLANALGDLDSKYADQVAAFQGQLADEQTQIGKLSGPTSASTAPIVPRQITVGKGQTQKQVIADAGITYAQLLALNPKTKLQGAKIKTGQKLWV